MGTQKIRVGIIFGGRSGEHEVSLTSARGIMQAIDKEKYEVLPIGITKEGCWIAGGDPMQQLRAAANLPRSLEVRSEPAPETSESLLAPLEPGRSPLATRHSPLDLDVLFPVLHGPFGEDGTVQGLFELAGIPYVGAGVTASAVGMDKALMKDVFRAHDLPVIDYMVIKRTDWDVDPYRVVATVEAAFP